MVVSGSTDLESLITSRTARVAIIGLGYVGLPVAVQFATAGFPVIGFDIDARKVASLNAGKSYLREVSDATLQPLLARAAGGGPQLTASTDPAILQSADVIQICVPTPCTRNKEPDTSHIRAAAQAIAGQGRDRQLVILRSTSYPGTTRELVAPILESSGRKVGREIHLAFAPERIDPGRVDPPPRRIPVVVGGVDAEGGRLGQLLFAQVVDQVVPVSSAESAEMTKLLENVFRNINIALVNQLAMLCDRMGLNVWEIIDAAATKPFGFMKFSPGPGVGGHCIPVDPYYLAWKAREYDFHMDFIELAARVNDEMPYFVVNKILAVLDGAAAIAPRRVLVLGVTFKRDVADERHSPAVKIMELLRRRGIHVDYHDPLIADLEVDGAVITSQALTAEILHTYDAVVIATDHSSVNYLWVVDHARRVLDTRNATRQITRGRDRIVLL